MGARRLRASLLNTQQETATIRGQKATACRGIEGNLVAGPPAFEPLADNIVSVVFQSECPPAQITVTRNFVAALATPLPSGAQVKLTRGQVPTVQEMADWIDGWTFFGTSC